MVTIFAKKGLWPHIKQYGSKVHGANMRDTWVLSAPGGPHVGLMNLAIWGLNLQEETNTYYHSLAVMTMQ